MLYLIATPIGNLKDITLRAIETLKSVDYILCEDTRRSKILLERYAIKKPLKSFHKFNEKKLEESIVDDLKKGKTLALISDAGSPLICDPGSALIKRLFLERLRVEVIPGPCSLIAALSLCPFDYERFQFIGFLPKKPKEALEQALHYSGLTLCFESPERLLSTLKILFSLDANACVGIARELTKLHEEFLTDTLSALIAHFEARPPKGECILLIKGAQTACLFDQEEEILLFVRYLMKEQNLSLKEAIKKVAAFKKIDKKKLYEHFHKV